MYYYVPDSARYRGKNNIFKIKKWAVSPWHFTFNIYKIYMMRQWLYYSNLSFFYLTWILIYLKKYIYIFYHQKIHVKPLSYAGSCDGAANIKKIVVTELNTFIDRWGRQVKRIMAELDKSYTENSKRVQNPKRST